ncbi:MAG: acyloxyacyl hydrolase [Rhodospirillaceae bacterium]|nr:acyloxyacyl hydrolase [Rhodospirillaceae bacterium]
MGRGPWLRAGAVFLAACAGFPSARADDTGRLMLGVGQYDIIPDDNKAVAGYVQYRFAAHLWSTHERGGAFLGFRPIVGAMANGDEGLFGYVGVAAPFAWDDWEFELSGGPGAYRRGESTNLGGTFQFHVGAALSRAVGDGLRLGVAMYHISNANIHRRNRGTNTLMATLTWSFAGP